MFCFLAAVLAAGLLFGWLASRDEATPPSRPAAALAAPAAAPAAAPGGSVASPSATPAPAATRRREERPNFDRRQTQGIAPARKAELTPARDARIQAAGRLAAAVPGARVDFDGELGSPKSVAATEGFLTGPGGEGGAVPAARMQGFAEADRHRVVKGFLAEHAALFGHGPEALAEARVVRDYETPHNGMRTTVWQQELSGVRVFESTFQAHVTKRGELVNVASRFVPDVAKAADAGTPNHEALLAGAVIDARQAVSAAAATLGEKVAPGQIVAGGEPEGASRRQQFRSAQLLDVGAEFVWLPQDETAMRLCWEVIFMSKARGEMFRTLVDAESGEALVRQGLTEYIGPASYRVFTSDSPTPMSPGPATPGSTQPAEVARTLVTLSAFDTTASPDGWIDDGVNETRGNNVDAHLDLNADNIADTPRPQGATGRAFDFPVNFTQEPSTYRDAAVTDLFYWNNYIHDRYYQLGFTEAAGNFQNNNFGRGGTGNDAVQADAQDGSGTNNANFSTPPDGSAGRMQMYVFTGPTPDRDGDFDHEIVIHEYTHGLSNRLVGGGVGISALQPRGMGEGWSDFYGLCLLSEPGDDPSGVYAAGAYATYQLSGMSSNYYYGIRRYPYCTDLAKNPLTFRDIDPTQASPHTGIPLSPRYASSNADPAAVHGQGEVWCATLWEARANLIAKHGAIAGNNLILQLVTDGMKLAPANPTFLQARDGILQADLVNNAGANRGELWSAFAKRGMGSGATSPASSTTTGVLENYDLPDDLGVSPVSALAAAGSVGGPFTPASKIYTLSNSGTAPLNWTAVKTQPWLTVAPASGTLATGATATVTATINANANSLSAGIASDSIVFRNLNNNVTQTRAVSLDVTPPRLLYYPLDTDPGWTRTGQWAFGHPTGGGGLSFGYPDPANGATGTNVFGVNLAGDYAATVGGPYYVTLGPINLANSAGTRLHFQRWLNSDYQTWAYATVEVSTNGTTWSTIFSNGTTTYTANSWTKVQYDISALVDGRTAVYIRWGYQIGSSGVFAYSGWNIDDIEILGAPPTNLTLTLPSSATEGAAPLTASVTVTPAPTANLTVNLSSGDPTEATVPASVVIPAGQTTATFPVTILNDGLLDGSQTVIITASATGYPARTATLTVNDDETATLTLSLPANATEGDTGLSGTVTMSGVAEKAVTVSLTSGNIAEMTVPATAVIPAGQSSTTFPLTIVNDTRIDGPQSVSVTAQVAGWTPGAAAIVIADNETAALGVALPAMREGDVGKTGTATISGTLTVPLAVALASSDTTAATVPASVTISAGQTSATFAITIVDDTLADGAQPVTITASAPGFASGAATGSVADNDAHHFAISAISAIAGTQLRNAPFPVTVTAKDVNDATITNFSSSVALTAPVPVTPATITAWVNGAWTGNVTATAFGSGVVLTASDGNGHTGASNPFDVTHGPVSSLAWSTIASPQAVDAPFPVTIRALDALGNSVPTFTGPAALAAQPSPPTIETGTGTSTTAFPFYGFYQESRLQTIYPASEMGGPATLTALALNVATASTGIYGNFTVRLKQTPLAAYTTASFDATGWTEVYRANVTPSPTGWLTLPFAVPFDYDGTNSLLVDISFDNAATATAGYVYYTSRTNRTIYGYANGTLGDPRTWSGTTGSASLTTTVPNLRFTAAPQGAMPLSPATTGAFAGGEWTGSVSVPFASAGLKLRATSGALTADSNVFAVSTIIPPSNSTTVFAEDFESGTLNPAWWTVTGTGPFRTINTNLNTPRAGARHMTMDDSTYGTYARNEATLTVNLAGRTGVALSFWAKEFNDVAHGPPASPFPSTGADFDGVAISADGGANWYEVQALRTLTATYAQFTVALDAALAARGLSYSANFKIRFNQYGNDYISFNGIAIDDILITGNFPAGTPVLALPAQVTEGAGLVNGTVSVPVAPVAPLVLSLASKSPAKISVPATVTIPAGQTSTAVPLTVLDDPFIDGTKIVVITATRAGFPDVSATVQVTDNDGGAFTLTLPATLSEGSGTVSGTLSLSVPALVPITVALTSSDSTEITLPASVTVGAGKTSATFNATAIEDGIVDGTQSVTVTANLAGWTDGTAVISVLDDGRDATLDWPTFGNGPAHTGYQPITLGATTYQAAWTAAFPTSTSGLNQVAIRDGMVFVTPYTYFGDTFLSARDASTGTERWRQAFVSSHSINPPTVNAGKVYVQKGKSTTPGNDSQLWCLDAAGGTSLWIAPFGAQWERYFAPTVVNDGAWVDGGTYGGLYGFNTGNGSQRFFNSSLEQYDQWTPSYYNGTIYTWVAGVFRAHDPMAGTILWSSTLSTGTPYSVNTIPAFDGGKAFAIGNPNLYAIDLTTRATAWTVSGTFKGSPATANGRVFALSAGDVKAYSSQTGALVGTYSTGSTTIAGQPIVTNDAVIVASPTATYIFNLQTFALRQTLPSGGVASLANGVIYLAGADGVLRTFRPSGQNAITLALSASSATEGGPALTGTVSLASALGSDTLISLAAGGSSRVTLPESVTIPAGQTSATFQLGVVNDSLLNGSETVSVIGRGPSYLFLSGNAAVTIYDDESATLALSVPASAGEAAGSVTGTLTLSAAPAANITVSLASNDTTEATVPATVIVLAGQTSATFLITIINDTLIDDTQTVTITAGVPGWTNATAVMQVTDNENRNLTLSGPYSVYEGLTSTGTVYISGTLPAPLLVTLTSSNPSQYSVPASVTIPAGQTSVSFIGTAVNDTATDGTQTATITASASAFTSATVTASAYDNDVHHFSFSTIASPQKSGIAFSTTISATDINNVTITPFAGTVALTAAGDGGTVALTPVVSGTFSSGAWTGNVTCATPRTNVVLTATGAGVTGTSNAFEVQLSPAIALSPASLALTLSLGQTTTRTLTISNTGGGTLTWSLGVAASLAEVVSEGPEFAGTAPAGEGKSEALIAPGQPDPARIYAEPRAPEIVESALSNLSLQSALNNLNSNNGLVRAAIPTRYAFTDGVTGTNISDGGNDMYDGGNFLGTNLGTSLSYSDNIIAASTLLGAGGQYFTRKYDGLWVFAADVSGLSYFEITGNLGADGGGSTDSAVLSVVREGVTYRGFVKRVYAAGDPSVNHLVIAADNGSVAHLVATSTDDDYHRITSLTGVTRIYHVLYAGTSGAYIDNTATLNIMNVFLDAISAPDWVSPSPSSGTVAAGASQNVTLTISAAALTQGTYNRTLVVTSNDPFQPSASVPVTLTVSSVGNLSVSPATGLTAGGLRGGPFTPAAQAFTLTNTGVSALNWTAGKLAPWLTLSAGSGTLNPGATVTVTATLNAAANALSSGAYADTIVFTNTTNGLGNTTRPVALGITAFGELTVTPALNLDATGPFGGPFTPASRTYTLSNPGDAAVNWTAGKTASWLSLSGASGTLAPGASTTVTATIAAATTNPGSYTDTITFTNTTNARGNTTRTATLAVVLPAPLLAPEPAATGGTGNTLSWSAVSGADGYEVQAGADAAFTNPLSSGWLAATAHTFSGLGDGMLYHYRARARRIVPGASDAWIQTSQSDFSTGAASSVSTAADPGSVVLTAGTAGTLTEDFDQPGAAWSASIFPNISAGTFERTALSSQAPNTTPPLPVNQGGDLEARLTGTRPSALLADTAQNRFADGSIEAYIAPAHQLALHYSGLLLRASRTSGNINGYGAILLFFADGTVKADFSRIVAGSDNSTASWFYSTTTAFTLGANENIRAKFSISGSTLTLRLWRMAVVSGVVTETAIPFYLGTNTLTATDTTYTAAGLAGIYDSFSNVNQSLFDDVTVTGTGNAGGYAAAGTLTSAPITPAPLHRWDALTFTKDTSAAGTALTVDVLSPAGTLLAANVASGTDLNAIPAVASQPSIRLRANLSTANGANTPRLDDWSVAWQTAPTNVAESAWSPVVTSLQDATKPSITVTTAQITTLPALPLGGIAGDLSGVASLTVNGTAAATGDGFLHWSTAPVTLAPGWNSFQLAASDNAVPPNLLTRSHSVYLTTPLGDADRDGLPDAWEAAHGLDAFKATGVSGATGDPDKDGVPNLLERAFGMDPRAPDAAGMPVVTTELNPADQQPYLVIRYRRLLAPGTLTYIMEVSRDCAAWSSAASSFEEIAPAQPTGDGLTETVSVRIKPAVGDPAHSCGFVRVRVSVP